MSPCFLLRLVMAAGMKDLWYAFFVVEKVALCIACQRVVTENWARDNRFCTYVICPLF